MDPFLAEIRIVGFNFAPTGWAFCNGQILPISQNTALFALLGTTYGGDGKSTFALPNFQGSAPMHPGQGQGLSLRDLGELGGEAYTSLLVSEIPAHTHQLSYGTTTVPQGDPTSALPTAPRGRRAGTLYHVGSPTVGMPATYPTGGSQPHNNMQPYLTMNFIIALQGVFPPRS
ncbi:microcystin-dependent protein [Paenibacillus phyllosphaerae]|uniref:Microcystin-dependent protein n=1 Tax=Paenibacillus phyllosphaerae TaxID=274593 RepID=A0A7W5B172_9BACL|nr:microcystin-dependent protein [Paenibacillus phyllosphaerae]